MALQLKDEGRITPTQFSAKGGHDPVAQKKAIFHYNGPKEWKFRSLGNEVHLIPGDTIILTFDEYFCIAGDPRLQRRYWADEKLRVMSQGRGAMWLYLRPDPKYAELIPDPPDTEVPAVPSSSAVLNPVLELEDADPITQRDQLKVLANTQMAQIKDRDSLIGEMRTLIEGQEQRLRSLESKGQTVVEVQEEDVEEDTIADIPEIELPPLTDRRGPGRPRKS